MTSKNRIFSEGPNGFSGWRPFTLNLIFSPYLTTSFFNMHSSDNSTQQKKEEEEFEPEELNITQFMQDQSDPESEEEVDFLNIKYRPFKHLPAKLSYKQIQEFRKKGLKTPNEQLNWLNTNKIWNSLNQDQKCLIAAHLLGDELFAKGEKKGLHLFTNEQKDGPMSIQFLCW